MSTPGTSSSPERVAPPLEFERAIPDLPFGRMALIAVAVVAVATGLWEYHVRSLGYAPSLDSTPDLWAEWRAAVRPDSTVIIGDSRAWFDMDLDQIQLGLGRRPIQLAIPGSCAFPVLADFAADEHFHGTVICSIVPRMFFLPGGPGVRRSEDAVRRYHTWTPAQEAGHYLWLPLDERLAFLNNDDLALGALLRHLPIPDRAGATVAPNPPPYFQKVDRDRRARMFVGAERPGELQDTIRHRWIAIWSMPPPPYVPPEKFAHDMRTAIDTRLHDTAAAVARIRARGGSVVFVRFPVSGELKKLEDRQSPRSGLWERLLKETGAPGIYFEDHAELASFQCPEWSHLSAADSVEFTKRLVPYLKVALSQPQELVAAVKSTSGSLR